MRFYKNYVKTKADNTQFLPTSIHNKDKINSK